ncbi:MAG: BTAD domain-containing putative transcriptional regulator [Burkholderiales bacterium]
MNAATHAEDALPARLRRPGSAGLIHRPRLFALIERARRGRVMWVHGPAGAGKTSLVSSWMESKRVTGLWYQLDATDADPATFFHFLRLAAQGATFSCPSFPVLTPEYLPGLSAFVQRWIHTLNEALPGHAVIVLDNYQEVAPDAALHAAIDFVLGALTRRITVIVLSRSAPPPALAAWMSDPDFHVLDWEQLRLTEEEAISIARYRGIGGATVDAAAISAMHARARGWAAGFILLLLARQRGVTPADSVTGAQQSIFKLLAMQMLERMPRIKQERLIACALPTVISSAAACEVAGDEAPEDLRALHAAGLFVDRRVEANGAELYEFHPLMREFLEMQAQSVLGAERTADARRILAKILEREGRPEEAIIQWTALATWNEVARLVAGYAPVMVSQGRYRAVENWVDAVPDDAVEASGWLLYWRGVARGIANPLLGRVGVERAYSRFMESNDPIGALCAAAEVLNQAFLARTDYMGIDVWLDRVDRLYAESESELTPAMEATLFAALNVCVDIGAGHPVWGRVRRRLDALLVLSVDRRIAGRAAAFGVLLSFCRGDIVSARRYRQQVEALHDDPHTPPAARIAGLAACMTVQWFDARHAEAFENSKRAYALIEHYAVPVFVGIVTTATFHAELSAGDIDRAARSLDRLRQSPWTDRDAGRAEIEALRAFVLSGRGEWGAAIEALQEPMARLERIGARFGAMCVRVQLGQAMWLAGRHDEARVHLERVLVEAGAMNAAHIVYLAHLWLAGSLLDTGDTTRGLEHLREAMASGRRHDYLNAHPHWLPEVMAKLFAVALEHDIEPDHVRRLILHRNLSSPGANVSGWPWPIRVYTLGRFALFMGEFRYDHGRKAQRRVLDLLKAIIAFGGAGVGREQLAAALWPDSDGAGALNVLEVTLYRLRKLLGRDDAIRLEHGEVSLDRSVVWVDTLAFERLVVAAGRMGVGNGGIEDAAHAAEKAMRLYYGPFLRFEEESAWQLPYQERLRSQFRRLMMLVARHWPASRAIDALERAIEIDPAAEELHRRLMTLLAEGGRQAEGVEAYQRCERVLRATLGVVPSAETRAVLQRLGVTRSMKGGANARADAAREHPSGSVGRARRRRM